MRWTAVSLCLSLIHIFYEKCQKIFFKKTKEKFKQEHPEVARYAKAAAYLAKHPDDKDSTQKELQDVYKRQGSAGRSPFSMP